MPSERDTEPPRNTALWLLWHHKKKVVFQWGGHAKDIPMRDGDGNPGVSGSIGIRMGLGLWHEDAGPDDPYVEFRSGDLPTPDNIETLPMREDERAEE